jgi:KaiC/GvpD/RAD55 family RecA-like ATPase
MAGSVREQMIPTGILELDELLSPDYFSRDPKAGRPGGFYVPVHTTEGQDTSLTPVVVIEGPSASGKTVLALQMATSILWNGLKHEESGASLDGPGKWGYTCFYYSLEQRPWAVIETIRGFDYFQSELVKQTGSGSRQDAGAEQVQKNRNLIDKCIINLESERCEDMSSPKLLFPRLSPRPIGKDIDSREVFKERYTQLEIAVRKATSNRTVCRPLFFIDSLSAFAAASLSRDEVHRLYSLFRSNKVPVIFTLERQAEQMMEEEKSTFTSARYLADVVVRLYNAEEPLGGYFLQHLEIAKTNYHRHILGRQLYKIRTTGPIGHIDRRIGMVIYPSLHFRLSKVITQKRPEGVEKRSVIFPIGSRLLPIGVPPKKDRAPEGPDETKRELTEQQVFEDMFIVVSGHLGGHKFALACNLLIWRLLNKRVEAEQKASEDSVGLIISLSEEEAINLEAVALHPTLKEERKKLALLTSREFEAQKIWENEYGPSDGEPIIKSLNFRMGSMMPEEFVYMIDKYIETTENIKAIVFSDTALLQTRFPLLSSSKLFIPTLVDTIKEKNLFSVFIDPTGEGERPNMQLLAAADCRIILHSPSQPEEGSGETVVVNFHVENVRAKNYDRSTKYLQVSHSGEPIEDILAIAENQDKLKTEGSQNMS